MEGWIPALHDLYCKILRVERALCAWLALKSVVGSVRGGAAVAMVDVGEVSLSWSLWLLLMIDISHNYGGAEKELGAFGGELDTLGFLEAFSRILGMGIVPIVQRSSIESVHGMAKG